MDKLDLLSRAKGFQWDGGNRDKNWHSHGVTVSECEQLFLNQPLLVADDIQHSEEELRYYALGQTDEHRRLFVVFTFRDELVRVVSARDMSRRERNAYNRTESENQ